MLEAGAERGRVVVQGPLTVNVLGAGELNTMLDVQLGPLHLVRRGDTRTIALADGVRSEGGELLRAQLSMNEAGQIIEHRIVDEETGALGLSLLETLLNLDALPREPVGVGARWRSELAGADGDGRTTSEHELLWLGSGQATFRVWRTQATDEARQPARGLGEWSWSSAYWPPTGVDQVSFALPGAGGRTLLAASFRVSELAE